MSHKTFLDFQRATLENEETVTAIIEDKTQHSEVTKNGVCKKLVHSTCLRGDSCPYSHDLTKIKPCHHHFMNMCRRGEECDFSHQITTEKMPVCKYLLAYGKCSKVGCNFKHVLKPCRDYDKGFCPKGIQCKYTHVPKKLCINYMIGFCPNGPYCPDSHPKIFNELDRAFLESIDKEINIVKCYKCNEIGHKITNCYTNIELPLDHEIYCLKCKAKHSADNCPLDENIES